MIKEHERTVLIVDLAGHGFKAGDIGAIVHVYRDGEAYELEVFSAAGHTIDVVTVEAEQARPVSRADVLHARRLSA